MRDSRLGSAVHHKGSISVSNQQEVFGTTSLFRRQVASALGIPAKYYDLMQAQKPTLLAVLVFPQAQMRPV